MTLRPGDVVSDRIANTDFESRGGDMLERSGKCQPTHVAAFAAKPARREAIVVPILTVGWTGRLGRLRIAHIWRQSPVEPGLFQERLALGGGGRTLTAQRKRDILRGGGP